MTTSRAVSSAADRVGPVDPELPPGGPGGPFGGPPGGPGGPPGPFGGPPGGPGGPFGGPPGGGGVFRAYRYGPDYPGLAGKDLTPGKSIEQLEAEAKAKETEKGKTVARTNDVVNKRSRVGKSVFGRMGLPT